ncbi:MmgE/PrpD family protein [Streptomyces sp. NPDC047081]|uniref:MmgE/PrpD family protein n=1 Tax=Streptomyces sp. NPDC047081 TaxID=3154706 RepID=UPI0033E2D909
MATSSERLSEFVAQLRIERIPTPTAEHALLHTLDVLGCGIAAHAFGEAAYALGSVREYGGHGPATAIGADGLSPADAAFVNGTLCHALDFDDTHPTSVVHVSAGVVPAAITAARAADATGADLLAAIVAGNEVSVRLGTAASGRFHARGFHPTGVCGVFGATAAAARARGQDAVRTAHALGIAGSMASGLLEFLADGSETKRLHPGWAARAGLSAVALAAHGATGPATVLEGARGFFATYLHGESYDLDGQTADLGTRWVTDEIAYKPYPACHYTHAPVDALAHLLATTPLKADDIKSITGFTDETGVALVSEPAADKVHPRTPYDAKFSLPYCLATRLVTGRLDVGSFTAEAVADPEVAALAPRIGYELRRYDPDTFGGGVRVETVDGRVLEHELRRQRGGAENPMSPEEVLDKFRINAGYGLPPEQVEALEHSTLGLASLHDLTYLDALAAATTRK